MTNKRKDIFKFILTITLFLGYSVTYAQMEPVSDFTTNTSTVVKQSEKLKDTVKDSKKSSFLPVPYFITDPNFGYGLVLAGAYIHPNKKESRKNTPPSITAAFGGGTTKGSWIVGGAHTHSWKNDNMRFAGAGLYFNVNLDFYQIGSIDLSENPVEVNLNGWGIATHMYFRLGETDIFAGPKYGYASIGSELTISNPDLPVLDTIADAIDRVTKFSALGLRAHYDNRENTISPNKGHYGGFEFNYNAKWLGSTEEFGSFNFFYKFYLPINDWLFSKYQLDYQYVGGDAPFYLKPYVQLRGVPAFYYQGEMAAKIETEWRAMVYKNWGVVGFVGTGKAFDSFDDFPDNESIFNYGTGLRYVMKKAFNTRVGFDLAWASPDSLFAWYIVIGTSF